MRRTFGLALRLREAGTRHDAAPKAYFHRRGSSSLRKFTVLIHDILSIVAKREVYSSSIIKAVVKGAARSIAPRNDKHQSIALKRISIPPAGDIVMPYNTSGSWSEFFNSI